MAAKRHASSRSQKTKRETACRTCHFLRGEDLKWFCAATQTLMGPVNPDDVHDVVCPDFVSMSEDPKTLLKPKTFVPSKKGKGPSKISQEENLEKIISEITKFWELSQRPVTQKELVQFIPLSHNHLWSLLTLLWNRGQIIKVDFDYPGVNKRRVGYVPSHAKI